MHHRWMIRTDLPQVIALEQEVNPGGWDGFKFLERLRQRNVIGLVVEERIQAGYRIAGFVIYEMLEHSIRLENLVYRPHNHAAGWLLWQVLQDKMRIHKRQLVDVPEGFIVPVSPRSNVPDEPPTIVRSSGGTN